MFSESFSKKTCDARLDYGAAGTSTVHLEPAGVSRHDLPRHFKGWIISVVSKYDDGEQIIHTVEPSECIPMIGMPHQV